MYLPWTSLKQNPFRRQEIIARLWKKRAYRIWRWLESASEQAQNARRGNSLWMFISRFVNIKSKFSGFLHKAEAKKSHKLPQLLVGHFYRLSHATYLERVKPTTHFSEQLVSKIVNACVPVHQERNVPRGKLYLRDVVAFIEAVSVECSSSGSCLGLAS